MMFISCNLDKWDLDDESNQNIPNYALSVEGLKCDSIFNTGVFALDNNSFITAVKKTDNSIKLVKISQLYKEEKWTLTHEEILGVQGTGLHGFYRSGDFFILLTSDQTGYRISKIDKEFKIAANFSAFSGFIDTAYNKINSISFYTITADTSSGIYLAGQLSSFSKKYSCVMKMDQNLKPLYVKTYFENDIITGLFPLNKDQFVALNQNNEKMSLIADNTTGTKYKKYDLTFSETFTRSGLHQIDGRLYLTGVVESGSGKTIEITLDTKNAYINDVRNFRISEMVSGVSSRNSLLISGVATNNSFSTCFLSEYSNRNYAWCNSYAGFNYVRPLAISDDVKTGLLYLFLVREDEGYLLHLLRTDEEGATLDNPYSSNCL